MTPRRRGRPPKEEPKFPDVTQMDDLKMAREPLSPPKAELFAQAIVRLGGDIRRAVAEVLDPLSDPSYTEFDGLPEQIQRRVKYLLNRAASDTVATREEVELLLSKSIRGQDDTIEPIDAVRELCKMKGWYSPVEHHNVHELRIPDRVAGMSDDELDRMIELGRQAELEDKSKEMEAAVIDVAETTDTTSSVMMKDVVDEHV